MDIKNPIQKIINKTKVYLDTSVIKLSGTRRRSRAEADNKKNLEYTKRQ